MTCPIHGTALTANGKCFWCEHPDAPGNPGPIAHLPGCAFDANHPTESLGSCVPGCPIGDREEAEDWAVIGETLRTRANQRRLPAAPSETNWKHKAERLLGVCKDTLATLVEWGDGDGETAQALREAIAEAAEQDREVHHG